MTLFALSGPIVGVLMDIGTWVFALGCLVLAALVSLPLAKWVHAMPSGAIIGVSGALPIGLMIGAVIVRGLVNGSVVYLDIFVQPEVAFGLVIWFAAGLLSAFACVRWVRKPKLDKVSRAFE